MEYRLLPILVFEINAKQKTIYIWLNVQDFSIISSEAFSYSAKLNKSFLALIEYEHTWWWFIVQQKIQITKFNRKRNLWRDFETLVCKYKQRHPTSNKCWTKKPVQGNQRKRRQRQLASIYFFCSNVSKRISLEVSAQKADEDDFAIKGSRFKQRKLEIEFQTKEHKT